MRLQPLGHVSISNECPCATRTGDESLLGSLSACQTRAPLGERERGLRRRRDSNPRDSRLAVFKTAAFNHSATPPWKLAEGRPFGRFRPNGGRTLYQGPGERKREGEQCWNGLGARFQAGPRHPEGTTRPRRWSASTRPGPCRRATPASSRRQVPLRARPSRRSSHHASRR